MSYELAKTALLMIGSNNELLIDKHNIPSVMVKIEKCRMKDLVDGGSENLHPAFIVNGVEKDYIYISKYPNTIIDGVPCSIPLEAPVTGYSYEEAKELCESKGDGWHLMTNAEYALLALIAQKAGTLPYGNNNDGEDILSLQKGNLSDKPPITLPGTGQLNWSHNHTSDGIFDLNGNVSEWVAGLRIVDGQIQVTIDNNAAETGFNTGPNSTHWRTINTDGSLGEKEETENTYYYDYTGDTGYQETIALEDHRDKAQESEEYWGQVEFKKLTNNTQSEILESLALAPNSQKNLKNDTVRIKNTDERLPRRGGNYKDKTEAGIFHLDLTQKRESRLENTGFRACYIPT